MQHPTTQLSLFLPDPSETEHKPIEEHLAPVQRRRLPTRAARRKLEERLLRLMDPEFAAAISRVVVDPEKARQQIQAPTEHRLQGGTLLTINVDVFSCGVLPFPANPRTAGTRRHAVAGDPGANTPAPAEVRPVTTDGQANPPAIEIAVQDAAALARLASVNAQAILVANNLVDSISHQGIHEHVFGVVARIVLDDGTSTCVLVTADGSSRITAAHRILDLEPTQALYPLAEELTEGNTTQFERYVTGVLRETDQIDGAVERTRSISVLEARQRALITPMTVVIGWHPHGEEPADLLALVRSKMGFTHVSGVKPWEMSSQNDAMADSVIDTLARESRIDSAQHRWLHGRMTPEEAARHNLPHLSDEWFVAVCAVVLAEGHKRAVNRGIRQMLPTGKRPYSDRVSVAVEIALRRIRSVCGPDELSRARVTLSDTIHGSAFTQPEQIDGRRRNRRLANILGEGETLEELLDMALAELDLTENLARRRISLLALWWLATTGLLVRVDGRSEKNPARPGQILTAMASSRHGLHILHQTTVDSRAGRIPRLVDADGGIVCDADGAEILLTVGLLREMFAERTLSSSRSEEISAALLPADRMRELTDRAVQQLRDADALLDEALTIIGDDGEPLFERFGLELDLLEKALGDTRRIEERLTEARASTRRIIRAHSTNTDNAAATRDDR